MNSKLTQQLSAYLLLNKTKLKTNILILALILLIKRILNLHKNLDFRLKLLSTSSSIVNNFIIKKNIRTLFISIRYGIKKLLKLYQESYSQKFSV